MSMRIDLSGRSLWCAAIVPYAAANSPIKWVDCGTGVFWADIRVRAGRAADKANELVRKESQDRLGDVLDVGGGNPLAAR